MNIKIRVVARAFKGKMGSMNVVSFQVFLATVMLTPFVVNGPLRKRNSGLRRADPIPQPLGYILRAHTFFYPHPPDLQEISIAELDRENQTLAREKKPSVWDQDDIASSAVRPRGAPRNREVQEKLDRYQEHRQRLADLKQRRQKAHEQGRGGTEGGDARFGVYYLRRDVSRLMDLGTRDSKLTHEDPQQNITALSVIARQLYCICFVPPRVVHDVQDIPSPGFRKSGRALGGSLRWERVAAQRARRLGQVQEVSCRCAETGHEFAFQVAYRLHL
jgi:hypothetical protein